MLRKLWNMYVALSAEYDRACAGVEIMYTKGYEHG